MIFYINFTTAACVLLILVSVNVINGANYYMKKPLFDNEIKDMTKTLSDKEIEMALSDLSLPDLKVLSKLIDSSNSADYDDETDDNSFLDSNEHMQTFYDFPDKNAVENGDDDNEPESDGNREPRNVLRFQIPRESLISQYSIENARAKREDSQNNQGNTVDAEYLKLLENSFPHGAEQNDHEDSENKKEHIRVKRKQILDKQEKNKLK